MKLGRLPDALEVNGRQYKIRTDYRDILRVIQAFHDEQLRDREKAYIALATLYIDLPSIPMEDIAEAYEKAMEFIAVDNGRERDDRPKPQVIDWDKDELLIFPAINKVAGYEVRSAEHIHWWTFMGYFQSISGEDTYGYILSLRQKKAKHKKLADYEKEFWDANRDICDLHFQKRKKPEDELLAIFQDLVEEQQA